MKAKKQSLVAHVDINSYFATLLQQENPSLRGRPVGVIKDTGRSCLIAVSKEAKARGVQTGASWYDVQHLVPEMVLVPAQFEFSLAATKRLQQIFKNLVPRVEMFSLDEAFLDLSDCQRLYPDPLEFGRLAQQKIKQELGEFVTSNVGIGSNRFLAKIASEVSCKGSVTLVNDTNLNHFLGTTAFRDVCGVGYRLERKLKAVGVTNLYALNLIDDATLLRQVGPYWQQQLRQMAQGEEPDLLRRLSLSTTPMKSVGRSITGYQLLDTDEAIKKVLYNLVVETTHKARQMDLKGRYVSLAVWGSTKSNQSWHSHRTLTYFLNQTQEMWEVVWNDLYQSWQRPWPVIKFAVRLGMLKPDTQVNQRIWPQVQKRQQLDEAVDQISNKYGLFTVKSGTLLQANLIRPEVTGFLGDKTYQLG